MTTYEKTFCRYGIGFLRIKQRNIMNEIELITKALKDAYKFVKEQEQTKETGELLITLFKAEILVKNCSIPAVSGQSEQLRACSYCGSNDIIIHQLTKFQSACNSCGA